MTTDDIIKLAGHRNVPAWVMKLVGDAVAAERDECAKIPRQHALELADGIFGKRFPDEALAVLRATDAMAEKIRARGKQ